MKEIIRNGIVNGELQAPSIFHMYTKGVLTADGIQSLNDKIKETKDKSAEPKKKTQLTDRNLKDYGLSWQNLNHSVVIVGWGTDPVDQKKYWIVRNSYGSDWGDHGEFMVQRGSNDFGIESETTAYDYTLCANGGC